ncbi:MAG: ABC transporter permease [Chloroflexota bacterium]
MATTLKRLARLELPGLLAIAVLLAMVLSAILAPMFLQSAYRIDALNRLRPPSLDHWFGTDNYGRDTFSRVVLAGRVSFFLGATVTLLAAVVGTVLGLVSGYYRRLDGWIMRVMDGMMAFPELVLAIALVAVLGPGLRSELIALSVVYTPRVARVARSATLQLREAEFVEAGVASGLRPRNVLLVHVLPNGLAPIIVQTSFSFARTLLSDAALSFLGLGVAPPTPTWGNMIADAREYITSAPWFIIFPGTAIVVAVVALNVAGDALRDLMDPLHLAGGIETEPSQLGTGT